MLNYRLTIVLATKIIILINIPINLSGDVAFGPGFISFGPVKYYSDPIFNFPELF
jgi:hypothetical protein